MKLKTGRHPGKETEYVLLRFGNDASYIMDHYPDSPAGKDYLRLADLFDAMPFTAKCYSCTGKAARASAYRGSPSLMFWCDECDPYGQGASRGKLVIVRTYSEAIRHVTHTCDDYRAWKNDIVRSLAAAKGCPARLTQKAAIKFFA